MTLLSSDANHRTCLLGCFLCPYSAFDSLFCLLSDYYIQYKLQYAGILYFVHIIR